MSAGSTRTPPKRRSLAATLLGAALGLVGLSASSVAAARPLGCEFNYPIAGSAGFANAQAARKTNVSTYGAAAFAERAAKQVSESAPTSWSKNEGYGFVSAEANWTFGAARVPTFCDDPHPEGEGSYGFDPEARWERKERVYDQPLDLYATNVVFGFGLRSVGAFYSASVTQSVLGQRIWVVPTQLINLYPVAFAPLIGNTSRGDGVASYTVDWIGGAWVDSPYFGARAGYTGARGVYGSVDERVVGLFGTLSASAKEQVAGAKAHPFDYVRAGVQDFSVRRFGAGKTADKVGMTSLFFRDLPVAGAAPEGSALTVDEGDRLRTVHALQRGIAGHGEVDATVALGEAGGLFEGHLGFHSEDFYRDRGKLKGGGEGKRVAPTGFLFKAGVVSLPPRYTLGVEGGRFAALRVEYRAMPFTFQALFNDPEQLALFPFATNALSLKLAISSIGMVS